MTSVVTGGVILLALDLMWSVLIVRLLYRTFLTNAPLKDLREIEDEQEEETEKGRRRKEGKSSSDLAREANGVNVSSKWHVE